MKLKGSDLFVKALEDEGVKEYIFGIPGEENLIFWIASHVQNL